MHLALHTHGTITKHHLSYSTQESVEASKYFLLSFYLLQEMKTSKDSTQSPYLLINYSKCIYLAFCFKLGHALRKCSMIFTKALPVTFPSGVSQPPG